VVIILGLSQKGDDVDSAFRERISEEDNWMKEGDSDSWMGELP
jgi:hypothetical protein